jgi:chondroitin AC lyase
VGAAAFQLVRGTLRARKAWFFFSNVVVCLGADIGCATDHAVVTTLNQCRLNGPVTVAGRDGSRRADEGDGMLDACWVWHDGIGYLLDKPTRVRLVNVARLGSWRRISGQRPADPVSENVFLLALSHGARPGGADYAYAVLPETGLEAMPNMADQRPFAVASNSAKVQAVSHAGDAAIGLVFHEAEPFAGQGWRVAVDRPCVLVIRREKTGWRVAVADPAAGSDTVRLELAPPEGPTRVVDVELPDGLHAGASTTVRLDRP